MHQQCYQSNDSLRSKLWLMSTFHETEYMNTFHQYMKEKDIKHFVIYTNLNFCAVDYLFYSIMQLDGSVLLDVDFNYYFN